MSKEEILSEDEERVTSDVINYWEKNMLTQEQLSKIKKAAEEELKEEKFREAVDEMKEQLRQKKWYHNLFPWRIRIERINN